MSRLDDHELAEHFVRGLHERCSPITFADDFFGIPATGSSSSTRPRLHLDLREQDFLDAVTYSAEQSEGLWSGTPPRRRAVQLMLVHADEDVETKCDGTTNLVLTLVDRMVCVRPAPR